LLPLTAAYGCAFNVIFLKTFLLFDDNLRNLTQLCCVLFNLLYQQFYCRDNLKCVIQCAFTRLNANEPKTTE